jgi:hypothetical protein
MLLSFILRTDFNSVQAVDRSKSLKNYLIIHEENTKKNHKRVVSVYMWYRFMLIYINFNFDFLGLDNVYF